MPEINPVQKFRSNPSRSNAIRAKCAECMGCTDVQAESGFRELIRTCSSKACPLHAFRPYQANSVQKPAKTGHLDAFGGEV
jgi:hypothetical protein